MKINETRQRRLDIVGQSARLNRIAAARTGDATEGHLVVHGVLSRALSDEAAASSVQGLDAALEQALGDWRARPAGAAEPE